MKLKAHLEKITNTNSIFATDIKYYLLIDIPESGNLKG